MPRRPGGPPGLQGCRDQGALQRLRGRMFDLLPHVEAGMMRRHPEKLKKAGITPERYQELQWICRQYARYKRDMRDIRAGLFNAPRIRSGRWSKPDPTGNTAARMADMLAWRKERVRIIERCASAVAPEAISGALLRSVTRGSTWDTLQPLCGRRYFYDLRLDYFIVMDAMISEEEER